MKTLNQCKNPQQRQPHRRGNEDEQILPRSRQLALTVAAAVASFGGIAEAAAEEILVSSKRSSTLPLQASFDLEVLKARGLDPKLAEYFGEAPRFIGGTRRVTLYLNGRKRGLVDAHFDEQGQLCFNRELIDRAGLVIPGKSFLMPASSISEDAAAIASAEPSATSCYDFQAMFEQTEVELRPGKEEVSLVVPTAALRTAEDDFSGYATGGSAALFNYDVISLTNQFSGRSNNYLSANTELGFNSRDWMVRSRQSYTEQDKRGNFQSLYTYAQRTLLDYKSVLQIGQINIGGSVVGGGAVTGFQIMPEAALRNQNRGGASLEGIAQTQARVEVHQVGALIYSTVVPAGPFSLTGIPVLNGNSDLIVTVIEANGAKRSFTVAAATLGAFSRAAPGYSFAVGKVRHFGSGGADDLNAPMVVTGSGGWVMNEQNQVSAGLMLAQDYQSIGASLDSVPTAGINVNVRNVLSSATEESVRGAQFSMSVSTTLTNKLSASASATRQTDGYRDLGDSIYARDADFSSRAQAQYSASLNWNDAALGGFSVSYSSSNSSYGGTNRRVVGSWSKTFKHATVSANIERSVGAREDRWNSTTNDSAFYVNVSVPMGKRRARTYVNNSSGQSRLGASLSEQVNDYVNYRVSTERKVGSDETDVSGNLGLLPRYAQVNLGYSRSGSGSTSYVGQLRGGGVLHEYGVTLSPYPIQDTFGVMKVGDVSGVRINTPGGPVWTDPWGRAVAPALSAYRKSRLEVATKTLPRNVDLKNGFKSIDAGRGSVHQVDFDVMKMRRVLMEVVDVDGVPIPKGASVVDGQGQFQATVVDNGKLFLSNGQWDGDLNVNLADDTQCRLDFELPEKPDLNVYFETVNAVCRTFGVVPIPY